jgi:hypothetical protein
MNRRFTPAAVICVLFLGASVAQGQEAILTKSAVQPGQGSLSARFQLRYLRYESDPVGGFDRVDEFTATAMLSYGLTGELALEGRLPISFRTYDRNGAGENDETTLDEVSLLLKWRVWREDYGPTNTFRVSVFGGFQTPMFGDGFESGGWNPMVGAVAMQVHDRHGWTVAATYEMTTSQSVMPLHPGSTLADAFFVDAAYLFRIHPAEYTAESTGAFFAVIELNSVYETNDDRELRLAPGLLYEACDFALEAGMQFPLHQELRHRPERDWSLTLGLRLLF